ncbi:MAG: NAD(P)-dependent oxidoreductase [Bdellovibrionales bacterium]
MKIAVLEKIEMSEDQKARLENAGTVQWFDSSTPEEINVRIKDADVVVVDWIDPSPFILNMKSPSLLALLSTGFGWVQHREEARKRGILIANVPAYSTEAVAEHLLGLILCVARRIATGDRAIRSGKCKKGNLRGIELTGRTLGIIGLGNIGSRLAQQATALGMRVVSYSRKQKKNKIAPDVSLDKLLNVSDVVAVCCPLNADSKMLLNHDRLARMKPGAILVSATWDVIDLAEIAPLLADGRLFGLGLDAAVEGSEIKIQEKLLEFENVVITPHVAFNTAESVRRQAAICIDNIEAFIQKKPQNIVN